MRGYEAPDRGDAPSHEKGIDIARKDRREWLVVETNPPKRVLLVEDQLHTRKHLAKVVNEHPRLTLITAAGTFAEAKAALLSDPPEVLLTDLGLPDGSGLDLIRLARLHSPSTLIMVLSVFGDEKTVLAALQAGAGGYLLKDGSASQIGENVEALLAGGAPLSPPVARHLLRSLQPAGAPTPNPLSPRQTEILKLVAKGFTFGEVADILKVSIHTVTSHVRSIYARLEVSSKSEAVFEALSMGLIEVSR